MKRLAGNRQLLVDLARFFIDDVPDLLRMLKESIRAENSQKAAWTARRLKCIAANFDASPTVTVAWEVESAARNGELDDAAAIEPELSRQIEAVSDILRDRVLHAQDGDKDG